MGASAPPGSALDWFGEMRVKGAPAQVQLYRSAAAQPSHFGTKLQIGNLQKALKVTEDGRPGPETWSAIEAAIIGKPLPQQAPQDAYTDERSERNIATLQAHVQPYARALYFKCKDHGLSIKIIDGTRTFAEQDALWRKGRDARGKVIDKGKTVTGAKGGYSNHNFGLAFDVGFFRGKVYVTDSNAYAPIGVLGQELGLEWGGTWRTRFDPPHFQLRPAWASDMSEREMIAELRRQFPNGV